MHDERGVAAMLVEYREKTFGKKGFSLVELIVVIAIIAVVTAIAVPSYIGYIAKAKTRVLENNAAGLADMIQIYAIDYGKNDWYGNWNQDGTGTLNNFIEHDLEVVNNGTYENNVSIKNPYSGKMSVLDFNNTIGSGDGFCPAVFLTANTLYAYTGNGNTKNIIGTVVAYFDKDGNTTDQIEIYYVNKDGSKSEYIKVLK